MSNRHCLRLQKKNETLHDSSQATINIDEPDDIKRSNPLKYYMLFQDDYDSNFPQTEELETKEKEKFVDFKISKKNSNKSRRIKKKEKSQDLEFENYEESIDTIIQSLSDSKIEHTKKKTQKKPKNYTKVQNLNIDLTLLNYRIEEDKKFGKFASNSRSNVTNSNHKKSKYKYRIIEPKNNWPPIVKSSFDLVVEKTQEYGIVWIKFISEKFYTDLTSEFWENVILNDTTGIEMILSRYPYHVESLLQLADICKLQDDHINSTDFIERAIYSFEMSKNNKLVYGSNLYRISFEHFENRLFYQSIYRHILNVSMKGSYSSALELIKLLYSFSPEKDPMGLMLTIDIYFMRAGKYNDFIDFIKNHQDKEKLELLPNIAFSLAYSYLMISQQEQASLELEKAFTKFPMFVKSVCDACNIRFRSEIENHKFFNFISFNCLPPVLDTLVCFYAKISSQFWKVPEVASWFLERAEQFQLDPNGKTEAKIMEFKEMRSKLYKNLKKNMLRCFHINDYSNTTITSYLTSNSIVTYSIDPHPPGTKFHPVLNEYMNIKRMELVSEDPILSLVYFLLSNLVHRFVSFYNFNPSHIYLYQLHKIWIWEKLKSSIRPSTRG